MYELFAHILLTGNCQNSITMHCSLKACWSVNFPCIILSSRFNFNIDNSTKTNNVSVDQSKTTNVEEVEYMGMNDLNVNNNNGGHPADSSDGEN